MSANIARVNYSMFIHESENTWLVTSTVLLKVTTSEGHR